MHSIFINRVQQLTYEVDERKTFPNRKGIPPNHSTENKKPIWIHYVYEQENSYISEQIHMIVCPDSHRNRKTKHLNIDMFHIRAQKPQPHIITLSMKG